MSVFGKYSSYYDLLYKDKDYAAEAEFVRGLVKHYKPESKSILEMGCGSGGHALQLANMGYKITGIDLSQEMLDVAILRRNELGKDLISRPDFAHGDIRTFRNGQRYDCVISLFHVISYQPTLYDLKSAFATAREHMAADGCFIFDVWYGPAVLSDPPVVRVKRMNNNDIAVTRIAEPECYPNECLVDVHYTVFIRDLSNNAIEELQEVHRMRYLSIPEIELIAEVTGLQIKHCCEWLTGREPSDKTWGVCFVLQAK